MVPGDTVPPIWVLRDRMATQAELSGEDVALWRKVKVGGVQQKVWPPHLHPCLALGHMLIPSPFLCVSMHTAPADLDLVLSQPDFGHQI